MIMLSTPPEHRGRTQKVDVTATLPFLPRILTEKIQDCHKGPTEEGGGGEQSLGGGGDTVQSGGGDGV